MSCHSHSDCLARSNRKNSANQSDSVDRAASHGWTTPQAQGTLGISRVALLPRLARCEGSLQAGRTGSRMGDSAALLTMLIFSLFFGRFAKVPSDGIPYPLFSFVGAGALEFLRDLACAILEQRRGKREPDHQGLLSAPGDPSGVGAGGAGRFCDLLRGAAGDDGVLPPRCRPSTSSGCPLSSCWGWLRRWAWGSGSRR